MNLISFVRSPIPASSSRLLDCAVGTSSAEAGDSDRVRMVMWIAIYSFVAVTMTRTIVDSDAWWHLRVGQLMVEQGQVMTVDQLSAHTQGQPWMAYSWLFEVLIYKSYQYLGLTGLLIYRLAMALLITVAIHQLVARRERHFLRWAVLVGMYVTAIAPTMSERPVMCSILFCAWTAEVVLSLREGRRMWSAWLLPVMYVAWTNLHIQFVYGLFIMGVGCVAPIIDRKLRIQTDGNGADVLGTAAWKKLVIITGLCAAATLINPFYFGIYKVVWEYGTHRVPAIVVQELQSMNFRRFEDWVALTLLVWGVWALGKRERAGAFEYILLMVTVIFAIKTQRDVWFMGLGVIAIVTDARRNSVLASEQYDYTWRRCGIVTGVVSVVIATVWIVRHLTPAGLDHAVAWQFPDAAVAEVERRGLAGPLYNHLDWGGYLEWRNPRMPPAIDGRTNLHGDARIARFESTWNAEPGWEKDQELAVANVVIAQATIPLVSVLKLHPDFETVFEDRVAVVFARKNAIPQHHEAKR